MDVLPFAFLMEYGGPIAVILFAALMALIIYRDAIKSMFVAKQGNAKITEGKVQRELLSVVRKVNTKHIMKATIRQQLKQLKIKRAENCVHRMLIDIRITRYQTYLEYADALDDTDQRLIDEIGLYAVLLSVLYDIFVDTEKRISDLPLHPLVVKLCRILMVETLEAFQSSAKAVCESRHIKDNEDRKQLLYMMLNHLLKQGSTREEEMISAFQEELIGFEYRGFTCGRKSDFVENDPRKRAHLQ